MDASCRRGLSLRSSPAQFRDPAPLPRGEERQRLSDFPRRRSLAAWSRPSTHRPAARHPQSRPPSHLNTPTIAPIFLSRPLFIRPSGDPEVQHRRTTPLACPDEQPHSPPPIPARCSRRTGPSSFYAPARVTPAFKSTLTLNPFSFLVQCGSPTPAIRLPYLVVRLIYQTDTLLFPRMFILLTPLPKLE